MIKAVLFDFDGVVADTEPLHMRTFKEVLAPLGIRIDEGSWYRTFAGTGSRPIIERLFRENGVRGDVGALVERRKELYAAYVRKGMVRPVKGIGEFLALVRGMGLRTAIVSGSHRSSIELVLATLGLEGNFDVMVGGEDTKAKKPDPGPFLMAAGMLGVEPGDCLVIEDSLPGMKAALAAGMRLVMIRSPACADAPAGTVVVDDFSEFPEEMLR